MIWRCLKHTLWFVYSTFSASFSYISLPFSFTLVVLSYHWTFYAVIMPFVGITVRLFVRYFMEFSFLAIMSSHRPAFIWCVWYSVIALPFAWTSMLDQHVVISGVNYFCIILKNSRKYQFCNKSRTNDVRRKNAHPRENAHNNIWCSFGRIHVVCEPNNSNRLRFFLASLHFQIEFKQCLRFIERWTVGNFFDLPDLMWKCYEIIFGQRKIWNNENKAMLFSSCVSLKFLNKINRHRSNFEYELGRNRELIWFI